jgi:hypothetical protein
MFSFDDSCRKLDDLSVTITVTILHSTLAQCPPWTLHAWPPLLWQVGKHIPLHLQHRGTQIMNPGETDACTVGQTLWAWHGSDGELGMAWDWVQLSHGLVAMADPMAVVSNLLLVDDGGDMLTPYESARHFNAIVHGLPWQDEVERALNGPGLARPLPQVTQVRRAGATRRQELAQ